MYHLFAQPGYSCLDGKITEKLREWRVAGKDVGQLGSNNGRELISLENLGAARAVGFDISDAAVDEVRSLARHAGVETEFVRTDIYEIPKKYNNRFDLLYISIGILPWMPNLSGLFQVAARILRAGRYLFTRCISLCRWSMKAERGSGATARVVLPKRAMGRYRQSRLLLAYRISAKP